MSPVILALRRRARARSVRRVARMLVALDAAVARSQPVGSAPPPRATIRAGIQRRRPSPLSPSAEGEGGA